ncbi:hypothetical protein ACEPPZ_14470 [Paracoccus yeei]|uniref:hypothetical protein n=1 Tax=Paracoccus yeei TaxID=147645 RepID=UPI0028D1F7CD|nr:hypothetical protein [Paracoccus yeei]
MPNANDPDIAGKATRRRRQYIPAELRALAKASTLPNMVEAPFQKGNNPSARRVRRLARKGWLVGWPFAQS